MDEYLLLLAGILAFIFGWNNSSILIGNERGSGTLSSLESTVLCSLGMFLGVGLEGSKMSRSIGGLIATQPTDHMLLTTLAVSVVLTFGLTFARIPVTFSATMVGALTGAAFVSSALIKVADLEVIFAFWLIAPVATIAATFACYKAIQKATSNLSLLSIDAFNRGGVGLVSLALAYVLSANNLGLIYETAASGGGLSTRESDATLLSLAALGIAGLAVFGRGGVAGTVGDRLLSLSPQGVLAAFCGTIIMMWVATQFAIPISMTQCLIGGMFGAALTKKTSIINRRLSAEVVASWAVVPLAAFAIALLVAPLI